MPDTIHIACFFDRNFANASLIMAASIARHCEAARPTTLHAFHIGDLDFDYVAECSKLKSPGFQIEVRRIENPFQPSEVVAYQNPAYYLRLAIAELLPDLDRVIYLDVDLLVRASLAPLYDVPLEGKVIAAVEDVGIRSKRQGPRYAENIHTISVVVSQYIDEFLGASDRYFNSGVLLIDLARWKLQECRRRALDFMKERYLVLFADQDALNAILRQKVVYVPEAWNYMPSFDKDISPQVVQSANIIHFAAYKPWRANDQTSPLDDLYWRFAMSTPFGLRLRKQFYWEQRYFERRVLEQRRKMPSDLYAIEQVLGFKSPALLAARLRRRRRG